MAGRNLCSIVLGDVSNCSYRLTVHPVPSSRLSSPRFFYTPKHAKPLENQAASASVYFNGQRPALSPAERTVTVGPQRIAITCTAVCVCARMHVCMCVHACMRDVFAIYDYNI